MQTLMEADLRTGRGLGGGGAGFLAAREMDRQTAFRKRVYDPLVDDLIKETQSTDIISKAEDTVKRGFADTDAMAERNLSRYGVQMNGAQKRAFDHSKANAQGLKRSEIVGNAISAQYDRNQGVISSLSNAARGLQDTANSGFLAASANETSVRNQKASIAAQEDAANTQAMASIASAAIMAFAMM